MIFKRNYKPTTEFRNATGQQLTVITEAKAKAATTKINNMQ